MMHYSSICITYKLIFQLMIYTLFYFFFQVQLNLMAPTRDNYYGNQQTIQGLVHHIHYGHNDLTSDSGP